MENRRKETWLQVTLSLAISLVLCLPAAAQTLTVKGVVRDALSEETIIGANVLVKGTTNGAISDVNGAYQLQGVAPDAVLVFSYIGV